MQFQFAGNSKTKRNKKEKKLWSLLDCSSMAELEDPTVMAKLIDFLSCLLQRVAESNDRNLSVHLQPQKISAFHGLTRPSISIQSYLDRIFKYANCSPCCFVIAYVYLDRFVQRQPSLPINSFNVHRLLITSVLVSAKFMDDTWVFLICLTEFSMWDLIWVFFFLCVCVFAWQVTEEMPQWVLLSFL